MALSYRVFRDEDSKSKMIAAFAFAEDAVQFLVGLPVGAKILIGSLVVLKAKDELDRQRWYNSFEIGVLEMTHNYRVALEKRRKRYAGYGEKHALLEAAQQLGKLEIIHVGGSK